MSELAKSITTLGVAYVREGTAVAGLARAQLLRLLEPLFSQHLRSWETEAALASSSHRPESALRPRLAETAAGNRFRTLLFLILAVSVSWRFSVV